MPRGSAEFLAEIRAGAVAHLRGDLAGGCPACQQLGRILDAHGGKFLHGRAAQPGAEGLLQLGPGAAQGLADLVHFQLPFQVFDKIGAGILHQGILAALPPDAGHGAAQAAAAPGQQDQQVFQGDDELLHRAEGQLLL